MYRNVYLDNVKGYLIVLVVLGHILGFFRANLDVARWLLMFIYIFHMPAFVFLSGYFSDEKKGGFTDRRLFFRNLLPFIICQLLFIFITYSFNPMTNKELLRAILIPRYALWYVYCLFFWRLVLPYFIKLPNPMGLSIFIGLIGGFLPGNGYILSISRLLAFFPFFMSGYYAKKNKWFLRQIINNHNNRYKAVSLLILICALISSVILNGRGQPFFLYYMYYSQTGQPIWFDLLARITTYSTAAMAGGSFMILIPRSQNIMTRIGERSMYVYLLHCMILLTLSCSGALSNFKDMSDFIIITLFLGTLLPLLLSTNTVQRLTRILVEPDVLINLRDNKVTSECAGRPSFPISQDR